jgi:ion channel-forming bestrophin family protein
MAKHSKWPLFLQMHGSITPKMIVPILAVAVWSTFIALLHEKVHPVDVQSILLTVTGFVVSIGLSLRNSTAYERYAEGRRYWGSLTQNCQQLGRVFWVHCQTRPEFERQDTLGKL